MILECTISGPSLWSHTAEHPEIAGVTSGIVVDDLTGIGGPRVSGPRNGDTKLHDAVVGRRRRNDETFKPSATTQSAGNIALRIAIEHNCGSGPAA